MKKKIFHNWGLKLVSLLLAFVLWFLAVQINDPKETVTFDRIPVKLTNTELLEQENKVYEVVGNTDFVKVTIRAPKSVIRDLRSSDIVAVADMAQLTDINTIPISYSIQGVSAANYDSIKGDHDDKVRLNVEERKTKLIRVQSRTFGEVAEGYLVASATADQNMISVTGPKSAVEKISFARVEVDVSGASTGMSLNVEPKLYDVDENLLDLPGISMNVSYIHMAVEVLAAKEVPVTAAVTGTAAEGYMATGEVECSPEIVKIAGPALAIAGVSNISIPAEQLDIGGATGDVESVINIRSCLKNDSIRFADSSFNGNVTVTVHVEPVVARTFSLSEGNMEFSNIPDGYAIELIQPEKEYAVRISGLQAAVSTVTEQTLTGRADVGGWLEEQGAQEPLDGDYTIPLRFTVPNNVIIEEKVTVKIRLNKAEGM